ncbi:MAG: ankyrin repeat domain-containing protein [Proteobacteria bacterium]|nr:ankyrin repeat domain-containing protein [Pseudomonadota bacterium]
MRRTIGFFFFVYLIGGFAQPPYAQTAPDDAEVAAYRGLLATVAGGKLGDVKRLIAGGADLNATDGHGRTPLMIAGYRRDLAAARLLIKAGADLNRLDVQRYDLITIAAVADHVEMVKLAIASGGNPRLMTSPYDGTALIAASHLGHVAVVQALIDGGAKLDHVNNLNWTALIESIVLGDGGQRHVACLRALVKAGANVNLADGNGVTPLGLARGAGYTEMVRILEAAGARQ